MFPIKINMNKILNIKDLVYKIMRKLKPTGKYKYKTNKMSSVK